MPDHHEQADRLYIVSRADLPIGLMAAQAAHAAFEFARAHWDHTARWMRDSNFIVLVTVPDLAALTALVEAARAQHCRVALNYEPDVGDTLTAIVVAGDAARRLCASLPLLGREVAMT